MVVLIDHQEETQVNHVRYLTFYDAYLRYNGISIF